MKKSFIVIIIICIILAVALVIVYVKPFTGKAIENNNNVKVSAGVKEFTIKASRYSYSPDTITVNKGDTVKITIENVDTPHGIIFSDFNVQGVSSVYFTADKTGEFYWHCLVPCGPGHGEMTGKLIVK